MSFNLKKYANSKKSVEETTEKQLEQSRVSKDPTKVQEVQLEGNRVNKDQSQITEKQLSPKDKDINESTQAQLDSSRTSKEPTSVGEVQLDGNRVNKEQSQTTENQLASSDLRKSANKKVEKSTEQKLNDLKRPKEPTTINEDQLEDHRAEIPSQLTEKQLDSPRKKATQQTVLVEGQLNESKGGLVKHRNEDASKGNINKLEEQRLAGEKASIQEKQKADLASETPKKMQFNTKPGSDGLRLAQMIETPEIGDDFEINGDDFEITPEENVMSEIQEDEDEDKDLAYVIDKDLPVSQDIGGTNIITGSVSFRLTPFLDEDGSLLKDLLEEKVLDHLSSAHSIKAPKLGEIRINVQEQTGAMGYFSTL